MIADFINDINIILDKLNISNNKNYSIYLSNENSLDLFINKEISSLNINIIHKLSYYDFNILVDNLKRKYQLDNYNEYYIGNVFHFGKNYNFKINIGSHEFNINWLYQDLISNELDFFNIYWNIYSKKFISVNNLHTEITPNYIEYFENLTEVIIEQIINDFVKFIYIVKLYFRYQLDYFKRIIDFYIEKIKTDKKFKKNIKSDYNTKSNENFTSILGIIKEMSENSNIQLWIKFINTNTFVNSLINNIDNYELYGININTFEEYIIILIINKIKIINNSYIKYIRKYFKSNNDNPIDFDNFDSLFIDKLSDYRDIKNVSISSKIEKYFLTDSTETTLYIKMAIHILYIMFYSNTNSSINIEYLKLGYIYKRYHYIKSDVIIKIFDIFKSIQKYLNISSYLSFEYFYSLFNNQILKDFESNKSLEIPEIRRKNDLQIDSIDIIEFQDTFGLFYEYIIRNNLDTSEYNLKDYDELFESELANIRSNKLFFGKPVGTINDYDDMYNNYDQDVIIDDNMDEYSNFYELSDDNKENEQNEQNEQINLNIFSEEILESDEIIESNNILESSEIFSMNNNSISIGDIDMGEIIYKLKYQRYKELYGKLKQVEEIIEDKNFDKTILENYNEITDVLIDLIIKKNLL
jgi:hypothetical protein